MLIFRRDNTPQTSKTDFRFLARLFLSALSPSVAPGQSQVGIPVWRRTKQGSLLEPFANREWQDVIDMGTLC